MEDITNKHTKEKNINEVESKVAEEISPMPKKSRKKFARLRKKKVLIPLFILLLISSAFFVVVLASQESQNTSSGSTYTTTPEILKMNGKITKVYDGDTSRSPSISIFNRVVKIEVELSTNTYRTVKLSDKTQISMMSGGISYYPIEFETIEVDNEKSNHSFYFELNRDKNPEALVISDEILESELEVLIDSEADYYQINTDLNLVFDENTNQEFVNLQQNLQAIVNGSNPMAELNLPNIDIVVKVPGKAEFGYFNNELAKKPEYTHDGYYPGIESDPHEPNRLYEECYSIDQQSLKPTDAVTNCEGYSVNYSVESNSKLVGINRSFMIFRNSFPSRLVNVLDSHDTLNKVERTVLGSNVEITEIISSDVIMHHFVVKSDNGDVYLISTYKYSHYSDQTPKEIVSLEYDLIMKVFESLYHKVQDDITPEKQIDDVSDTELEGESSQDKVDEAQDQELNQPEESESEIAN